MLCSSFWKVLYIFPVFTEGKNIINNLQLWSLYSWLRIKSVLILASNVKILTDSCHTKTFRDASINSSYSTFFNIFDCVNILMWVEWNIFLQQDFRGSMFECQSELSEINLKSTCSRTEGTPFFMYLYIQFITSLLLWKHNNYIITSLVILFL